MTKAQATAMGLSLLVSWTHAGGTSSDPTELQRRLTERDAEVRTLRQRLEELEQRLDQAGIPRAGQAASSGPCIFLCLDQADISRGKRLPPAHTETASSRGPSNGQGAGRAPSGPGRVQIDELAAQRALERTLRQSGALLLSPRQVELTPSISYSRYEQQTSVLATIGGNPVLASQSIRSNSLEAALGLRIGLPAEFQMEFGFPYARANESRFTDFGSAGSLASSSSAHGSGDGSIGIAKALLHEKGWHPDVLGRLTYGFGNGKRDSNSIALGGGYRQVQLEVVALKRQDPLAFFASGSYTKVYEQDSIKPGNSVGFSVQAALAASPETALQFGIAQSFQAEEEIAGSQIPGSKQVQSVLTIGASSVLTRRVMLNTQLGVGLTNDAPKYYLNFSLPILSSW